jgi:hypothetical protein
LQHFEQQQQLELQQLQQQQQQQQQQYQDPQLGHYTYPDDYHSGHHEQHQQHNYRQHISGDALPSLGNGSGGASRHHEFPGGVNMSGGAGSDQGRSGGGHVGSSGAASHDGVGDGGGRGDPSLGGQHYSTSANAGSNVMASGASAGRETVVADFAGSGLNRSALAQLIAANKQQSQQQEVGGADYRPHPHYGDNGSSAGNSGKHDGHGGGGYNSSGYSNGYSNGYGGGYQKVGDVRVARPVDEASHTHRTPRATKHLLATFAER